MCRKSLKINSLDLVAELKQKAKPASYEGERIVTKPPKYCGPHRPSGKAYVWVKGKQTYLPGQFGSPESVSAYRVLLDEFAGKKPLPTRHDCTVAQLFDAWFDDNPCSPKKYSHYLKACEAMVERGYADCLADDFGPRKLRDVRQLLIESGLAQSTINQRVGRIKKVFKWGVSQELVSPSVSQALYALDGIRSGETSAPAPRAIKPVSFNRAEEIRGVVSETIFSMLHLLWLTGMRPDNVCQAKMIHIKKLDDVWLYTPEQHKNKYRGKGLVITIGPVGQAIITKCQGVRADDEFIFRPQDSIDWHIANNSKYIPWSTRRLSDSFTPNTLRQAVLRAQAHKAGMKFGRKLPNKKQFIDAGWVPWTVYQLRHAAATELRQAYPMEDVRAYLGHSTLDATQIYTEHDLAAAKKIALERG